jgi:hypothetical protein
MFIDVLFDVLPAHHHGEHNTGPHSPEARPILLCCSHAGVICKASLSAIVLTGRLDEKCLGTVTEYGTIGASRGEYV